MKNNLLVRFLNTKWFFAIWISLLLIVVLLFYRAFGLEPGLSASGHKLWQRGLGYALVVFTTVILGEYSFESRSKIKRRIGQFLLSYYILFCCLNFFWLGMDWQWTSALDLLKDYSLFWILVIIIEWLLIRLSEDGPKTDDLPLKFLFKDEQAKTEIRIRKEDLRYIKSDGNYVEVHYQDEGQVQRKLLRQKLKNCREQYPRELIQIHRSYLVSPLAIEEVFWHSKQASLALKGGLKLKIGQAYQADLKKYLSDIDARASHS